MKDQNYDRLINLARITAQAERNEETIKYMEEIVKSKKDDLTIEERNILSTAYKNCVSERRSAWRNIIRTEVKEETKHSKYLPIVSNIKETLRKELSELCHRMLMLIDNYLLKKSSNDESKVYYMKLKGDYFRYLAEFMNDKENNEVATQSMNAYKEANEAAEKLSCTNSTKLGLALNYSVFYYEVKNDPFTACKIASAAFEEAIHQLEKIEDDEYKESINILQLLKENIDMWRTDNIQLEDEDNKEE
ncbi:MAG: 14-3-3 family protein [archaeon]|nr:14-3-3 family protein [archaeon]